MAFITLTPIAKAPQNFKTDFKKKVYRSQNKVLVFMNSDNIKKQGDLVNENKFSEEKIPGKIKLSEIEIVEREKKLRALSEKWKKERITKEEFERKLFGFTKNSEILNGRMAMFFLTTGLLTELWTKQSIITQIDTMLRTLGLL